MDSNPELEQIDVRMAIDTASLRLGQCWSPSADGTDQRRRENKELVRRVEHPYPIGNLSGFIDYPGIDLHVVAPPRPVYAKKRCHVRNDRFPLEADSTECDE